MLGSRPAATDTSHGRHVAAQIVHRRGIAEVVHDSRGRLDRLAPRMAARAAIRRRSPDERRGPRANPPRRPSRRAIDERSMETIIAIYLPLSTMPARQTIPG